MRDQRGFSWTNTYDAYGRRTESHDPDAGDRAYVYDAFDRLRAELEASSGRLRTRYHYDELSRATSVTSLVDGEVRFEWDTAEHGIGMLASAERVDDGVRHEYGYDRFGRLATERTRIDDEVFALDYGYDDGTDLLGGTGLLSSITYPEVSGTRRRIDYVYDVEHSRLPIAVNDGPTTLWAADGYDALGRVTEESFGDGTHTLYEYGERDHVPWLQHVETTDASGGALVDLDYAYDVAGNVTQRSNGVGPPSERREAYTYDRLSRLRTRQGRGGTDRYDYDSLGNLTNHAGVAQTYSSDHPHQLATVRGQAVSYDARGRITDAPGLHVGSYTDFDMPRVLQSGTTTASFRFDAMGERAVKQEQDSTTVYVHGLFERRTPRDPRLGTSTWNVSVAGRTIAQITRQRARTTTSYLHADRNGSPVLVSGASATPERYAYEPFGRRRRIDAGGGIGTPSAPAEREGFTGAVQDGELGGLVYLGARMYSPSMGRFMSPDPIVGSLGRQGWNAYTYAANNPETLVDPTGMWADELSSGDVVGGVAGLAAGAFASFFGWGSSGTTSAEASSPVAGPGGQSTGMVTASPPTPTAPRPATATRVDSSGASGTARDASTSPSTGPESLNHRALRLRQEAFAETATDLLTFGLANMTPERALHGLMGQLSTAAYVMSYGLVGQDHMAAMSQGAWRGANRAGDLYWNHYCAGDYYNDDLNRGMGSLAAMVLIGVPMAIATDGVVGELTAVAEGGEVAVAAAEGVDALETGELAATAGGASLGQGG